MRITYKGDYALKAILDLALHYSDEPVTINDMARRIDAPLKFLEQVLLLLKRGGFIESRRGKVGGYLLSRSPDRITLGEVIRYVDGPLEPISCVKDGYVKCHHLSNCVLKNVWHKVYQATSQIVDQVTFEDLRKQSVLAEGTLTYAI